MPTVGSSALVAQVVSVFARLLRRFFFALRLLVEQERSSCASGCLATKSSRACTSRPSYRGSSISTVPPDCPKPRGSQVSTLEPCWMKLEIPGTPKALPGPPDPCVLVSPGELQPGPSRIVGAGSPWLTPLPTNQ